MNSSCAGNFARRVSTPSSVENKYVKPVLYNDIIKII